MGDEKISFCGLDCLACPVYIASQQGDKNALERIAFKWSNEEIKFNPEEIDCVGCTEDGQHFSWCDICPIRKCGKGKKIKNCAYCIYYPCEELNKSLQEIPKTKQKLEEIRKNL
ncbi:MAG: DUF3795 domain-containing protein [Promethearchaeota archaeon]